MFWSHCVSTVVLLSALPLTEKYCFSKYFLGAIFGGRQLSQENLKHVSQNGCVQLYLDL